MASGIPFSGCEISLSFARSISKGRTQYYFSCALLDVFLLLLFFSLLFFSFRPSSLTPSKWQEKNRAFWPFSQFLYGILCLKVKCHLLGVTMLAALKNHFTYVERHLSRQMDQFSTAAKKKSSWTSSSSFFLN